MNKTARNCEMMDKEAFSVKFTVSKILQYLVIKQFKKNNRS